MAAVPRFTIPSIPVSSDIVDSPRRPAAAILRFHSPRTRALIPVAPVPSDIAAGWAVTLALAVLVFVLF
jgi:hypothetical protein